MIKTAKHTHNIDPEKMPYMDIFHDPNIQSYKQFSKKEKSFQVENFLDDYDIKALIECFNNEFKNNGIALSDRFFQIAHPFQFNIAREILEKKLKQIVGDDAVYYSDLFADPILIGDNFFRMVVPYGIHTDSITHRTGYIPYKDVIIPLQIHNDIEVDYIVFNQRYYRRACNLAYNWHHKSFMNYTDCFRLNTYDFYGVEDLEYDEEKMVSEEYFFKYIGDENRPYSIVKNLSVENKFNWKPGSAIVQDQTAPHCSGNFRKKGVKWKLGIAFHFVKKEPKYIASNVGPTGWSRHTLLPE